MKCLDEKFYLEFLDNEIRREEKKRVLTHLEECGRCRRIVKQLKEENVQIKEIFETDLHSPDLVSIVMNEIVTSKSQSFEDKKFWSFLIYGIFIVTGILAPCVLLSYIKSTDLFQNIFSFLFTPFSLASSLFSFLLRTVIFITPEEITGIFIGQIFVIFLFMTLLRNYFIKEKKNLEEDYK